MGASQGHKVVVFQIGNEEFGLPIDQVVSIERVTPTTQIPKMPDYVKGVINLRDQVIPIVDLRMYLLNKSIEEEDKNRIIIADICDTQIGFLVDHASDVLDIPMDRVETVSVQGIQANHYMKVAKIEGRLLILLDMHTMLTEADPELFEKLKEAI